MLYHFIYQKSTLAKILLITIVLIQIVSLQTYGLFIGVFAIIMLYFFYKKKYVFFTLVSSVILFTSLYLFENRENIVDRSKLYSVDVKISQIQKGLEKSSAGSLLFGDGIGAKIKSLDSRNLKDDFVIEVAPVMLYVVGGIFGSLLILYIYLWYPIKGFFLSCKINNNDLAFLSISQLGIIIASFTNPYVWSGGMGIFLITMIICINHNLNLNETKLNKKLSIICTTYNSGKTLQRTIDSIKNQTFQDFEFIIVDAKSTDNTLDIIKNNQEIITKYISETDKSIFDGMNKGLDLSIGEWVYFIGSDDYLYNNSVLENIFKNKFKHNTELVIGNVLYSNGKIFKSFGIGEFYSIALFIIKELFTNESCLKTIIITHRKKLSI